MPLHIFCCNCLEGQMIKQIDDTFVCNTCGFVIGKVKDQQEYGRRPKRIKTSLFNRKNYDQYE